MRSWFYFGLWRGLGFRLGDFPITEKAAGQILSLPMYPDLTACQQERVAAEVLKAINLGIGSEAS